MTDDPVWNSIRAIKSLLPFLSSLLFTSFTIYFRPFVIQSFLFALSSFHTFELLSFYPFFLLQNIVGGKYFYLSYRQNQYVSREQDANFPKFMLWTIRLQKNILVLRCHVQYTSVESQCHCTGHADHLYTVGCLKLGLILKGSRERCMITGCYLFLIITMLVQSMITRLSHTFSRDELYRH